MKHGLNAGLRGFTLLETLVAMAVVAIAMGALWKGLAQGQYVSRALPERVLARWVAQNRVVTRQVMGEWPETRTYSGTDTMAGREWQWQEEVRSTGVSDMRRITVQVGKPGEPHIYILEAYLHRSQSPVPYERLLSR